MKAGEAVVVGEDAEYTPERLNTYALNLFGGARIVFEWPASESFPVKRAIAALKAWDQARDS